MIYLNSRFTESSVIGDIKDLLSSLPIENKLLHTESGSLIGTKPKLLRRSMISDR